MPAPSKNLMDKLRDDQQTERIRLEGIPENLDDYTVLDLGGYDGKFARLALDRGAISATVVDNKEWIQYEWGAFEPKPGVRYVDSDIMDWHQPADLVICYNVLYHVKQPLPFLRHLRKLTRGTLSLCTSFVEKGDGGWVVYPTGLGHPNKTVWCRPTPDGLTRALFDAGFLLVREIGRWGDHIVVRCA